MSEEYLLSIDFKDKLKQQYEESKGRYERLVDEVLYFLRDILRKKGIKVHSLTHRESKIKTFASFYDKIVRQNVKHGFLEAVEDIAGVRIICLYRSDLKRMGENISKEFDAVRVDTSRTRTESPFGYASDHYIVKLPKGCTGPRYDDIKNLKCEIQVRTILMDAWASVSHHLDYKQEVDVPTNLRADFNALSGLFYVADTHFELFRDGIDRSRTFLMQSIQQDSFDLNQEINLDSLTAYFKKRFRQRKKNWSEPSLVVSELRRHGYETLHDLDAKINIASPVLKELERKDSESEKEFWSPDGLIRVCLDLTDDKYFEKRRLSGRYFMLVNQYRSKLR